MVQLVAAVGFNWWQQYVSIGGSGMVQLEAAVSFNWQEQYGSIGGSCMVQWVAAVWFNRPITVSGNTRHSINIMIISKSQRRSRVSTVTRSVAMFVWKE